MYTNTTYINIIMTTDNNELRIGLFLLSSQFVNCLIVKEDFMSGIIGWIDFDKDLLMQGSRVKQNHKGVEIGVR